MAKHLPFILAAIIFLLLFSVSRFLSIFQFLSCLLLHFQDSRALRDKGGSQQGFFCFWKSGVKKRSANKDFFCDRGQIPLPAG
jgi:hypothetical protein